MSDKDTKDKVPSKLIERRAQYKMAALSVWPTAPGEVPDSDNLVRFAAKIADAMMKEDNEAIISPQPPAGVLLRSRHRK